MAEAPRNSIEVEVVYALPQAQTTVLLTVAAGSTVSEAIARSGMGAKHPEVDWNAVTVGIYGEKVTGSTVLKDHDRIEIYRPLTADPKQARRNRAHGRSMKRRPAN